MADITERLAVLETQLRHTREELQTVNNQVSEVSAKLDNVSFTLNRQRGFIAGMSCVLVPLWAIVVVGAKAVIIIILR